MKLFSREQIESLAKTKSDNYLITSFFFDTDKSNKTKKEVILSLKNLLNQAKTQVEAMDTDKTRKDSLLQDLQHIQNFMHKNLNSYPVIGMAAFSCQKDGFWQVYELPAAPRNRVVFDRNPYVRPLSALLNANHKTCILVFDRKEAQWFDLFLGEIAPLFSMVGDVPSKVKEGGWEGYESKRIERHIATHLQNFLKKIADKTFSLDKENSFDWLLVGGPNDCLADFQHFLHPYLKKRWKGRLKAKPGDPQEKILKDALQITDGLKKKEDEQTVQRFVSELEKGGLAVSGLKSTLKHLNRGAVQTLIVTRHFIREGRKCPRCQFLFTDELKCPSCQIKTDKVDDIIDEAVEAALDKNGRVEHINPPMRLGRYGKIGAFLRYRP
jgi:peptide subunit release factor 1 (eRF1)